MEYDDQRTLILDERKYKKEFKEWKDVFPNYQQDREYSASELNFDGPYLKLNDLNTDNERNFYFKIPNDCYLQIGKKEEVEQVKNLKRIEFLSIEVDPGNKLKYISLLVYNIEDEIHISSKGLLILEKGDKISNNCSENNKINIKLLNNNFEHIIHLKKKEKLCGLLGPWWKIKILG